MAPAPAPSGTPREKIANAEARRSRGKWSAINECAAGVQPASPTPTPMRNNSNCTKPLAVPHSAVMVDQTTTHREMILTRLWRSARRAMGKPSTV
ncbi:hypothetical protein D3C71_2029500 [compost metagenome]